MAVVELMTLRAECVNKQVKMRSENIRMRRDGVNVWQPLDARLVEGLQCLPPAWPTTECIAWVSAGYVALGP
jgi:hypothetical protein